MQKAQRLWQDGKWLLYRVGTLRARRMANSNKAYFSEQPCNQSLKGILPNHKQTDMETMNFKSSISFICDCSIV